MTRTYCDRCAADTTGLQSAHVMAIDDADEEGNGDIVKDADLCADCYLAFLDWLAPTPAVAAVDPPASSTGNPRNRRRPSVHK